MALIFEIMKKVDEPKYIAYLTRTNFGLIWHNITKTFVSNKEGKLEIARKFISLDALNFTEGLFSVNILPVHFSNMAAHTKNILEFYLNLLY